MPSPALFLCSLALSAGGALALFSQGTINDRDYSLTYTGYDDTTAFCTAFRGECVEYVGALNYHHNLDCVVSQSGPTISAWCGGVEKDASGDTGSGPALDFTALVCPEVSGCTVAAEPKEPVDKYNGAGAASSASAAGLAASTTAVGASSTTESAAAKAASTSATVTASEAEEVPDSPPTDSSLAISIPSTATWSFAVQSSLPSPAAASAGVSTTQGAAVNAASPTSMADEDSGASAAGVCGAVIGAGVVVAFGAFFA
ncbi:hypothetical protein JCM6882_007872 [Rhodosporidiobolus microsporus]